MSCTTIKVTVVGSPSGVLSIMKAASQAVKDAESARDESFLSRDAAKTSASESSDSARKAQASASDSAQSALKAKESEGTAQGFADDAQTSMVGAKGAMAQAKVYRDQAKQFAGQRLPVDVKHDGKTVGVGLLAIDFVGSGVDVVSTGEDQYKVTIADSGAVTPIAGADLRVKISANSKGSIVNLKADTFDVSAGDCVGIQVKSDKVDGCFLESTTPSQPLVLTTIEYLRVV